MSSVIGRRILSVLCGCFGWFFNVLLSIFLWGGNWSRVEGLVLDACSLCYRWRRGHWPLITPHWEPKTFSNWGVLRWVLGRFNTSAFVLQPFVWWHVDGTVCISRTYKMTRYLQFLQVPCASFWCANRTVAMFNQQEAGSNLAKAGWLNCVFLWVVFIRCIAGVSCQCGFTSDQSFWRKLVCHNGECPSEMLLYPLESYKPVRCQVKTKRIKPFVCCCCCLFFIVCLWVKSKIRWLVKTN